MFASLTTHTFTITGTEPPVSVTVHKLSGKDFEAAQFEHQMGIATGSARNWAVKFLALAKAGKATDADANRMLADPLAGFDRLTLAKCGIAAWSCVDAQGAAVPVAAAAIEDLEDEPLEQIATEVLKLTKPHLFKTVEEAEIEQKNG